MNVRQVVWVLCVSVTALAVAAAFGARAIGNAFAIVSCSTVAPCDGGANSSSGNGVRGTSNSGIGVVGTSSTGPAGVFGSSPATIGVWGNGGKMATGVSGTSGQGVAVSGTTGGLVAINGSSTDASGGPANQGAVMGTGTAANGVYGNSTGRNAGYFENSTSGFFTLYAQATAMGGYPFEATAPGGSFYVDGSGNGYFTGSVQASAFTMAIRMRDGNHVGTYASQATRAQLEDVGTARIVGGRGVVQFDSAFARTIDFRAGYQVFLTPGGDNRGLYVALKSPGGFEVREAQGGRSTLPFDYRVVARPLGSSGERLPLIRPKSTSGLAKGRVPQ